MLILIVSVALTAVQPAAKALPPVAEPDWTHWRAPTEDAKQRATAAWATLCSHRADRVYKTEAEQKQAERAVEAAYGVLDASPLAACAVGAGLLRSTKDDWERLMISNTIRGLGKDQAEPFVIWALAKAANVDSTFEPVFYLTYALAKNARPQYLPAIFAILRVHDGQLNLPLHAWAIPSSECLACVFLRYGRDAIPYLYPMLKHDDPYVRNNAAIVLGYFMDKNAKPMLLEMLKAGDVGSCGAAAALGALGAEEAITPIARMLESPNLRLRFYAAYALYELGSQDALPALETAMKKEQDENVRNEMSAGIAKLHAEGQGAAGTSVKKLNKSELQQALDQAEAANGLAGEIESIAASAGAPELKQLEQIRLETTNVLSDLGNKWFKRWTSVIKDVSRRPK